MALLFINPSRGWGKQLFGVRRIDHHPNLGYENLHLLRSPFVNISCIIGVFGSLYRVLVIDQFPKFPCHSSFSYMPFHWSKHWLQSVDWYAIRCGHFFIPLLFLKCLMCGKQACAYSCLQMYGCTYVCRAHITCTLMHVDAGLGNLSQVFFQITHWARLSQLNPGLIHLASLNGQLA